MKTFVVKTLKTIEREVPVEATTAKEAKRLAVTGEGISFDASSRVSNTVSDVAELRGRLRLR